MHELSDLCFWPPLLPLLLSALLPLPLLLQFLLSEIFPELINHKIVKPVFAVVVTLLFVCPQVRGVDAEGGCSVCQATAFHSTSPADVVPAVSWC